MLEQPGNDFCRRKLVCDNQIDLGKEAGTLFTKCLLQLDQFFDSSTTPIEKLFNLQENKILIHSKKIKRWQGNLSIQLFNQGIVR